MRKSIAMFACVMAACLLLECGCSNSAAVNANTQQEIGYGHTQVSSKEEGKRNSNGIMLNDSVISWANMEVDNPSLSLDDDQLAVVSYFDNDYIGVQAYELLQKYPKVFRGSQIFFAGRVSKVLSADDDTFECLVTFYPHFYEPYADIKSVVIKGSQPDESRIIAGDEFFCYGRYIDVKEYTVDGGPDYYPLVTVNYFSEYNEMGSYGRTLSIDDARKIAKGFFGDDVKISLPKIDGYDIRTATGLSWYIATPDNQTNAHFSSFEIYSGTSCIRPEGEQGGTQRTVSMAADFEHYYVSVFEPQLHLLYLECYDRGFNKVWSREFDNVDTVPFDYTSNDIYLSADNQLYIIDAKSGKDKRPPVFCGQKAAVSIVSDGVFLVGPGKKDGVMKVDFSGNILWSADTMLDIKSVTSLQVIDGRLVSEMNELAWDEQTKMWLFVQSEVIAVDSDGTVASEFVNG